jgi:hypothetical protein
LDETIDGSAEARARIAALILEERRLLFRECALGLVIVAVHLFLAGLCVWAVCWLWSLPSPLDGPSIWGLLKCALTLALAAQCLVCVAPFFITARLAP